VADFWVSQVFNLFLSQVFDFLIGQVTNLLMSQLSDCAVQINLAEVECEFTCQKRFCPAKVVVSK
jgi:hypothetical protein